MSSPHTIEATADVARVLSLPRRRPTIDSEVALISQALRLHPGTIVCPVCSGSKADPAGGECKLCNPQGHIMLRPQQAEALREAYDMRGLFAPMRVGSGKTLVTLLLPFLLQAQRPVLLLPASMRPSARRAFVSLRRAWKVRLPTLLSYEEMSRPDREFRLLELRPDLIIMDEADAVKNWETACARRLERAIATMQPMVAVLSGTLVTPKLLEYHHHLVWALRSAAPAPLQRAEAERWCAALSPQTDWFEKKQDVDQGALRTIPGGFHSWMRDSRGVVPTRGKDTTAELRISQWCPDLPAALTDMIERVTETKERPDGEPLDQWDLPDCLCQLAQGFYYVWDPLPPAWWLEPRRAWRDFAQWVLEQRLPGYDSESQIVSTLDGEARRQLSGVVASIRDKLAHLFSRPSSLPHKEDGLARLTAWRAVRDRFIPNPVPVWIDDTILRLAVDKARAQRSLVWTRHTAAGARLQQLGLPYYGGGMDPEKADPRFPMGLSIPAYHRGKNLQAWDSNIILVPPAADRAWEQLIGRTDREGQKSSIVSFDILSVIDYHFRVVDAARAKADAASEASGFPQKLTEATFV